MATINLCSPNKTLQSLPGVELIHVHLKRRAISQQRCLRAYSGCLLPTSTPVQSFTKLQTFFRKKWRSKSVTIYLSDMFAVYREVRILKVTEMNLERCFQQFSETFQNRNCLHKVVENIAIQAGCSYQKCFVRVSVCAALPYGLVPLLSSAGLFLSLRQTQELQISRVHCHS